MDLLVLVTGEGSQGSNQQRCSVDLLVLVTGEGSQGSNQQRCSVDLLVLVTGEGSQGSNQQRCSVYPQVVDKRVPFDCLEKSHAPCTSKTSFVDFEKE